MEEKVSGIYKIINKINGKYYVIPNDAELTGIGSIVGLGNSIDECIKKIEKLLYNGNL